LREAAMTENYGAFKEARRRYLRRGKDYNNFLASLRHLDPISAKLNDEAEARFATEFLTSVQRKQLRVARDYAHEVELTLWTWWHRASEEDDDEAQRAQFTRRFQTELIGQANALSRPMPTRLTRKNLRDGVTLSSKRAEWIEDIAEARRWFDEHDVAIPLLREVYWRHLRATLKTPRAQQERLGRLIYQLRKVPEPVGAVTQ